MIEKSSKPDFDLIHRYWQASNYLSVGQVRLRASFHKHKLIIIWDLEDLFVRKQSFVGNAAETR